MVTRSLLLTGLVLGLIGCGTKTPTAVVPKTTGSAGANLAPSGQNPTPQEGGGRNTILQMPFDQASKIVMLNIGLAYRQACIEKPPKNHDDLGQPQLWTKRDLVKKDVEVLYGVDVLKLGEDGADKMLAWEKEADANGGRMVLMADAKTVNYFNEDQFKKTPKAK